MKRCPSHGAAKGVDQELCLSQPSDEILERRGDAGERRPLARLLCTARVHQLLPASAQSHFTISSCICLPSCTKPEQSVTFSSEQ